jgi:peptidoglycan/LPS O-acetylase OafA/YrhL
MMMQLTYRPEIDGLRAIAVIPVILFHLGASWMPGGYLGVDVFFVISGFLITSIIISELSSQSFTFRQFWARRIRRILPAMLFVTGCTLATAFYFSFRPLQHEVGAQATATLASFANVYYWLHANNYWAADAESQPLLHTWSLSVEEQFYLIFPFMIWALFRVRREWLHLMIGALTIGSVALFLWGTRSHPGATFYLLPTRMWELGIGCLLATTLRTNRIPIGLQQSISAAGLSAVLISYVTFATAGYGSVVAVLGAACVVYSGHTGICKHLLAQPPLIHIGKLSYSMYLWHWPLIAASESLGIDCTTIGAALALLAFIYALSLATYRFIELPTRRREGILPKLGLAYMVTASASIWMTGHVRYYDVSEFTTGVYETNNCHPDNPLGEGSRHIFGLDTVRNTGWSEHAYSSEGITVGDASVNPQVVLFGDSHGCMWSSAIRLVIERSGLNGSLFCIGGGCSPFTQIPPLPKKRGGGMTLDETIAFDNARVACLEKWRPRVVIIGRRWRSSDVKDAKPLLRFLESLGTRVILIEDPPVLAIGNRNATQVLAQQGVEPTDGRKHYVTIDLVESTEARQAVRDLALAFDNAHLLPTWDLYSSEAGSALVLDGRDVLYLDDDHLLKFGARMIAPRLQAKIEELLKE